MTEHISGTALPEPQELDAFEEIQIYRKKPVEIEATQYGGVNPPQGKATVETLLGWGCPVRPAPNWGEEDHWDVLIATLEGEMLCTPGDWVIRGIAGEFYPCKDEIFQQTYEKVYP